MFCVTLHIHAFELIRSGPIKKVTGGVRCRLQLGNGKNIVYAPVLSQKFKLSRRQRLAQLTTSMPLHTHATKPHASTRREQGIIIKAIWIIVKSNPNKYCAAVSFAFRDNAFFAANFLILQIAVSDD